MASSGKKSKAVETARKTLVQQQLEVAVRDPAALAKQQAMSTKINIIFLLISISRYWNLIKQ